MPMIGAEFDLKINKVRFPVETDGDLERLEEYVKACRVFLRLTPRTNESSFVPLNDRTNATRKVRRSGSNPQNGKRTIDYARRAAVAFGSDTFTTRQIATEMQRLGWPSTSKNITTIVRNTIGDFADFPKVSEFLWQYVPSALLTGVEEKSPESSPNGHNRELSMT
jgi:hypothetical protein